VNAREGLVLHDLNTRDGGGFENEFSLRGEYVALSITEGDLLQAKISETSVFWSSENFRYRSSRRIFCPTEARVYLVVPGRNFR
jgi:hypothetical protein